ILLFFSSDTPTSPTYTLSLHDALPISLPGGGRARPAGQHAADARRQDRARDHRGEGLRQRPAPDPGLPRRAQPGLDEPDRQRGRSEEHTSELQSLAYLVCRLLLEKKK